MANSNFYDPMAFAYEEFGGPSRAKKKSKSATTKHKKDDDAFMAQPNDMMKMVGDLTQASLAVALGIYTVNQVGNLLD